MDQGEENKKLLETNLKSEEIQFHTELAHSQELKQYLVELLCEKANYYDIKESKGSWLAVNSLVIQVQLTGHFPYFPGSLPNQIM